MFDKLKDKLSKSDKPDEKEYTFIWYKKMDVSSGGKLNVHYTQPYRTKVTAKTRNEAVKKCQDFAMSKMQLVVVDEEFFDKTKLGNIQQMFSTFNKAFDSLINN